MASPFAHDNLEKLGDYHARNDYERPERRSWKFRGFTTGRELLVEYPRNPTFARVFDHLATLKTYSVDRAPKMTDLKRVLRLSGMLMQEGIDEDADEKLRLSLTDKLAELRDGYVTAVNRML